MVVDEEIYRRLPALLIATVDKFAQMPWNGADADALRPGERAVRAARLPLARGRGRDVASEDAGALPAAKSSRPRARCGRRT